MKPVTGMTYKQLFLLILTIWSAEICTRFLFDNMLPHRMEYRTIYLPPEADGEFKGAGLGDFGRVGWELVSVQPNPNPTSANPHEFILFMQRRAKIRIDF